MDSCINIAEILGMAPTKSLVEELLKREGVEHKKVAPYIKFQTTVYGPAILIMVID